MAVSAEVVEAEGRDAEGAAWAGRCGVWVTQDILPYPTDNRDVLPLCAPVMRTAYALLPFAVPAPSPASASASSRTFPKLAASWAKRPRKSPETPSSVGNSPGLAEPP